MMPRLMSVSMTEQAVIERRKTVTRRKGWWLDKHGRRLLNPGDRLTLCRKVMGRKHGEPLVRLAEVGVISVRREPLSYVLLKHPPTAPRGELDYGASEMAREGFPGTDPLTFIDRYFTRAQGISANEDVTRIEWRYLPMVGPTRPWTDDTVNPGGGTLVMKRACNGCGRPLGDVTEREISLAIDGVRLPDVRRECGCLL